MTFKKKKTFKKLSESNIFICFNLIFFILLLSLFLLLQLLLSFLLSLFCHYFFFFHFFILDVSKMKNKNFPFLTASNLPPTDWKILIISLYVKNISQTPSRQCHIYIKQKSVAHYLTIF